MMAINELLELYSPGTLPIDTTDTPVVAYQAAPSKNTQVFMEPCTNGNWKILKSENSAFIVSLGHYIACPLGTGL